LGCNAALSSEKEEETGQASPFTGVDKPVELVVIDKLVVSGDFVD
jgi:hypothetical protein